MLLLSTLNIFRTLLYCYYCWIQTSKFRLGLRNYSFRQYSCFQNCENISLWAGKICWAKFFHPYSSKIRLWKNKFSQQCFKKITGTLMSLREIYKLRNVTYFGEFSKLGENFPLNFENIAKKKLFCHKNISWEALTCSRTLGIIVLSNSHIKVPSYIFWKKNPFVWFFTMEIVLSA